MSETKQLKDYVLNILVGTAGLAFFMFAAVYLLDKYLWKNIDVLNLLFPFSQRVDPDTFALAWLSLLIILLIVRFSGFRKKWLLVILLYLFALSGLATLTAAIIAGGGLKQSPLAAFFPVALAINIVSTSKPRHIIAFFVLTTISVIIVAWACSDLFANPLANPHAQKAINSPLHSTVYDWTFGLALLVGFVAGLIKQKSTD